MPKLASSCPLSRSRVVDLYFLEHRAKLIDLAAFLDRVDRARPDGGGDSGGKSWGADLDFRLAALHHAIALLLDGKPQRARRVLEALSDPTAAPLASAAGMKGAAGAWKPDPSAKSESRNQKSEIGRPRRPARTAAKARRGERP